MTAFACLKAPAPVVPGRFANKVAIVTGAAQGIGRAVALRFAAEGGRLVAVDRSEIVREVAELAEGLAVTADLATWEAAERGIRVVATAPGGPGSRTTSVLTAPRLRPRTRRWCGSRRSFARCMAGRWRPRPRRGGCSG